MSDHPAGCSCCSSPLDPTDFDVRSVYPDPVLAMPEDQRAGVESGSSLIRADGVGTFVRCLMPVGLTGGNRVTYSCWLRVEPDAFEHARAVWTTPAYAQLALSGTIANAIQPWPLISGEPATAEVRDSGQLPYLVAAEGTHLWRVLNQQWNRDEVLSRIWHALPTTVHQRFTSRWSVDRTAGLTSRLRDDELRFVGPGRTVALDAWGTPPEAGAEGAIALMTEDAPTRRDGERTEHDGAVVRHAFWLTVEVEGRSQHELYGWAAVAGDVAGIVCMYDDPADLDWAQGVWRSLRHHPGTR